MNLIVKRFAAVVFSLSAATAFASPTHTITHNKTNEESNAYIAGTIPSPYPTPANSTRQTFWNLVKLACYGHTKGGKCSALIKMATNTDSPIDVGTVVMDLESGDITPKKFSGNGYTVIVNGPGEATITKP